MNDKFDFGYLRPWIEDELITDINYNGTQCWIDHLKRGRFPIEPFEQHEFMQALAYKLANYVNLAFNIQNPLLEAETKELRISMLHPSICRNGLSISIRKTPAIIRLDDQKAIRNYAPKWVINYLKQAVIAKANILVSGLPGSGKTELIKYLMQTIPADQRVITIEDTLELRYGDIHPNKDNIMIKVNDDFNYAQAIKASLRQRPDWICVSEVRSEEVLQLLQSSSTGASVLSTLHASSAHTIPQRLLHMMPGNELSNTNITHLIHQTIDVGVHLEMVSDGYGIHRRIKEIVQFNLSENKALIEIVYDDKHSTERQYEKSNDA
jgi:pilus assembly protein CpaF